MDIAKALALLSLVGIALATANKEQARKDKRHQWNGGYGGPIAPVLAPAVPAVAVAAVGGACPGGDSLGIPCDAKRPWPQCPPQSYCYASNTVDIGPYYCCPVWSTYGSQWRPKAPFYPYYPPMPYNWPAGIQATAGWPAPVAPALPAGVPFAGGYGGWGRRAMAMRMRRLVNKRRAAALKRRASTN